MGEKTVTTLVGSDRQADSLFRYDLGGDMVKAKMLAGLDQGYKQGVWEWTQRRLRDLRGWG